MINKAICCQCVLWLKSKIAKISTLKVKRIAKSLKFDPVNNSSLKVDLAQVATVVAYGMCGCTFTHSISYHIVPTTYIIIFIVFILLIKAQVTVLGERGVCMIETI